MQLLDYVEDMGFAEMHPTCVVVQCFNKADTLRNTLESLIRCAGSNAVDLIIWSDSAKDSKKEEINEPLVKKVQEYLTEFILFHRSNFRSINLYSNEINRGTCKTCQLALDHAFSLYSFAIFAEDDVIFARDALQWFDEMRQRRLLESQENWAIAGESVFFNARHETIPDGWPERMRKLVADEGLNAAYVTNKFIPSTCFATTRERWAEFGASRGEPLGDVVVCNRCVAEGRHSISPVVPRVKDVGMLHEHGYSVSIHTRSGVQEIKNTYVMSDEVDGPGVQEMAPIKINPDRIYYMSTLLRPA